MRGESFMFDQYMKKVMGGDSLTMEEAHDSAQMLLHDSISDIKAAAFLSAMRTRKESVGELSGFVHALYEEAITIDTGMELIDTCGTGGDGLNTFNISTATALVVASCGIPVAKHGNSAVTGKVGSADVLEALGVNILLQPDEAHRLLDKTGISFFFAPFYHPVLKGVGPLRRALGVATIFNFLGPLLNPCKPVYQVIGIYDQALQKTVAETLMSLGRKRALVVHGENGMDEINPVGSTLVYDIKNDRIDSYLLQASSLGIGPFSLADIQGGDLELNAQIVRKVLEGKPGPHREAVIINTAAALMTAGQAEDMNLGMQMAAEAIDDGRAMATLRNMISYSRDGVMAC